MKDIHIIAAEVADLCVSKNAAYGDSIGKSVEVLKILYSDGLRPDQYFDALVAARDFEKRSRIAQGADAHGEDPRLDIVGYGLLALHQKRKVAETCASVSAPAAEPQSQEPSDSTPTNAPAPTTPPASGVIALSSPPPSSSPSASSSASTAAAPARVATEDASSPSAALVRARECNERKECPRCLSSLPAFAHPLYINDEGFYFCTPRCSVDFVNIRRLAVTEAA